MLSSRPSARPRPTARHREGPIHPPPLDAILAAVAATLAASAAVGALCAALAHRAHRRVLAAAREQGRAECRRERARLLRGLALPMLRAARPVVAVRVGPRPRRHGRR